jgi:hypothetical protein
MKRSLRNATIAGMKQGTFIKARNTRFGKGGYATLVIEGDDQDGPAVAGIALDVVALDRLILRLSNMRKMFQANHDDHQE